MVPTPAYPDLLRALTLGTARREVAPQIGEWLDELAATDPTADTAEHLLAAAALTERVYRLQSAKQVASEATTPAPPEPTAPPSARLAGGLRLILEGTYPDLLDEAIELVETRKTHVPAALLPSLHPRAAALLDLDYTRAMRYVQASGERGKWLARQHPDWERLAPDYDYAAAWQRETRPAQRANLLAQWRHHDPAAALVALDAIWSEQNPRNQEVLLEGLRPGLSSADHVWLREALVPKRKNVRRALARLLLLSEEPRATADFRGIATSILGSDGRFDSAILSTEWKEVFKTYGGMKAPQTLPQLLLEVLPPASWGAWIDVPQQTFWVGLDPLQLRGLTRAFITYDDRNTRLAFTEFLLRESPQSFQIDLIAELASLLTREDVDGLFEGLLNREKNALRLCGLPRTLALHSRYPWSERLSRAMVTRLLEDLRSRQLDYATQRELADDWKRATPRLDVHLFPWLRQQLHTTTERYDAFGKLAVDLLQTTAFRQQLHRP